MAYEAIKSKAKELCRATGKNPDLAVTQTSLWQISTPKGIVYEKPSDDVWVELWTMYYEMALNLLYQNLGAPEGYSKPSRECTSTSGVHEFVPEKDGGVMRCKICNQCVVRETDKTGV